VIYHSDIRPFTRKPHHKFLGTLTVVMPRRSPGLARSSNRNEFARSKALQSKLRGREPRPKSEATAAYAC
jgi:hypothetical protein